jgi:ubiquinone/menaquinone biosynthesis C-methylase UbiE
MSQGAPTGSLQQQPSVWDAIAPTYAEDVGQWSSFAEEALRTLPVARTDRVLDVAAGPGTLAFAAAERAAQVDAVDFSQGMIDELRKKAENLRVANVKGAVMSADALTYADDTFDAAFCLFAFFFFPDRARAFGEMRRVLKPGGRALIATWSPIERRPVMRIAFEAMAETLPHLPRPTKGDLQDPDECVREMRAAGFTAVTAHTFTASVRVDSAETYCDLIVRSAAPFAAARKKMDAATWQSTMARLIDATRARIPEGGAELSAEAIFTLGARPDDSTKAR